MFRRFYGDEVVDAHPRITRGKRKGLLKGHIEWVTVTRGGWDRETQSVLRPSYKPLQVRVIVDGMALDVETLDYKERRAQITAHIDAQKEAQRAQQISDFEHVIAMAEDMLAQPETAEAARVFLVGHIAKLKAELENIRNNG